jgi:hypothetical protein
MVEECRSLSIANLVSSRIVVSNCAPDSLRSPQTISWSSGFEVLAQYEGNRREEGRLRLVYTIRGERIEDKFEVTSMPSPLGYGRRRYYFTCGGIESEMCGRRAGKLYLPPGERYFACRNCHDLTYRSSKEHDKRMDMFCRMSPKDLARALTNPDWNMRHLAFRAALQYINGRSKG